VIASLNRDEVGSGVSDNPLLYNLAISDPENSYTIALVEGNERFFNTARAIVDASNTPIALVVSRESLSAADKKIDDSIRNSIILFICIVALVMFLFFRHSRIIDYASLYKRLKEVDQLKDDFLGMASHELRTPMTIIRGYADYIRDASSLDESREYAKNIDDASKRLDALVGDMLDVSRIQQGRMAFTMERLDPGDLIKTVIESFQKPGHDKGLSLTSHLEPAIITADKERMRQVLINLIGNAIKYSTHGEITVTTHKDVNKYIIRVSDTGIGMTAEEQKHLFEKFYRAKNQETENISGTGLGLWITSEMVRKMGGSIGVESIKGKGTDFVITFPLS
jgi:signal transduction histidine kinase